MHTSAAYAYAWMPSEGSSNMRHSQAAGTPLGLNGAGRRL